MMIFGVYLLIRKRAVLRLYTAIYHIFKQKSRKKGKKLATEASAFAKATADRLRHEEYLKFKHGFYLATKRHKMHKRDKKTAKKALFLVILGIYAVIFSPVLWPGCLALPR